MFQDCEDIATDSVNAGDLLCLCELEVAVRVRQLGIQTEQLSSRVGRTFTMANSDATKNAFASSKRRQAPRAQYN